MSDFLEHSGGGGAVRSVGGETPATATATATALGFAEQADGLLGRIDVIESQPLDQRAQHYDQLAEELLAELQRSDSVQSGREAAR